MQASLDPPQQPSVAVCLELLRATPALSAFRRTIYRAAPPEARGWLGALGVVTRHDGIRPGRVAELLHVDFSVASRHLAQLEELGYVERHADPSDRRANLVHATAAGRDWVEGFATSFATSLSGVMDGWTDDDVRAFTGMLDRFDDCLEGFPV